MIDVFLQMPIEMQIFCVVAMFIGLAVMWRFRWIVLAIAAGAAAIWYKATQRKK